MSNISQVNHALRMEFTPELMPRLTYETLRMVWAPETLIDTPKHANDDRPAVYPKPPGQVSELSKGGYSLRGELRWDNALYCEVHGFVLEAVKSHLNTQISYSSQSQVTINRNWPTRDMLKIILKNSSQAARRTKKRHDTRSNVIRPLIRPLPPDRVILAGAIEFQMLIVQFPPIFYIGDSLFEDRNLKTIDRICDDTMSIKY
ncbi:hypothetical protein FIBSPDRAFT_900648 [Athelia psychrophila]|uniref:Uncharacterized protein n=1 Tax=Athelia psychrophila TaxID=1759441 RepID=A0A165Y7B6_9AGAM|nr:hypothetical protein FIBSPDRAFT_900648 [Fibularhizoctonia sp. CBS 109695]